MRRLFNFYLDSSIHVALAVYALVRVTMKKFNILFDDPLGYFVFFGTIVAYNFIKYGSKAKRYFIVRSKYTKLIQALSVLCFLAMCFFALQLSSSVWTWVAGLTVLSLLYIIPFFPNKKNFRSLHGIKIYIVALSWAGVTVILPMANNQMVIDHDALIEIVQRFLFVIAITLPFEIRDLRYDQLNLGTIPQKLGVKGTRIFGSVLMGGFLMLTFFKDRLPDSELLVNACVALLATALLWGAKKEQAAYYSSFWVESIPIVWLLLLIAF